MDEFTRNSLNWEDFFGSSLDLAPSLLNLYDHRVASGTKEKDSDRKVDQTKSLPTRINEGSDRKVDQTKSLPTRTNDNAVDGVTYRGSRLLSVKLLADRPVSVMDTEPVLHKGVDALADNKKRPLSISSVSSTSLTSSPRLRKKRASTFNGGDAGVLRVNSQLSSCTVIPDRDSDSRLYSGLEPRHSVDSGCVDGDKNGDRGFDSMSATSSETGSSKDETDSSVRDYSVMQPSHSDRRNICQLSHPIQGSNMQHPSHEPRTTTCRHDSTVVSRVQSSTPNKETQHITSPGRGNNSSTISETSSPDVSFSLSEYDTCISPTNSGRSYTSSSRQDARLRFFSNYEEHLKHSSPLQAPIAEENFEISPNPKTQSSQERSSISHSQSEAGSPTAALKAGEHCFDSPSLNSSRDRALSPTSTVPKSEHRRERSAQLSPGSDKISRRSDRHGAVSKHDQQSTSPRLGLSRTSKKREPQTLTDSGSRSSPVYVSYVSRVVTEIIESERTYIASLENIIHGYLEPMERILDSSDTKKDIVCLFSNIREIYQFGCLFLSDLEMTGADPVKVAQCFVKYNKGFVIYTDYCTNYPRAVEVLTRFMQHPDLSQLCKERQLALGHGLPLGAYLLKPVQRILKYHLLLHNIVKNCEKEQKEATILEQAFHHMTQMAHHINEMKRKHEHAVRIQEIQSQLEDYVGEDLTRLGELVLEGPFKVSGAKASRQVFLFERGLLISKIKEGGMLSCKTFIRCSNLMLVEVIPNEPLSFHIIPFDNPRAQDTLQARNMEQKRRWCHDIKQQILDSFKGRIPDNAKNLIMQLGSEHDNDYISKETLDAGRRNQHTAPEYLEKRRFRRKSGSRLPDFRLLKPQKSKKAGNKKNDIKSGEKISAEMTRRSESKSPEGHQQIHSKQIVTTKRRSQSTSTVSLSSLSSTYLHDRSPADNHAISWPDTKTVRHSSSMSACTSPQSPVYRISPKRLTYSKDGKEQVEKETEILKRPVSFLMARANPILSEDITQLLARCGSSRKILNPSLLKEEKENLSSLTDFQNILGFSLKNRSDGKEFSDTSEQKGIAEEKRQANNKKDNEVPVGEAGIKHFSKPSENATSSPETETSQQKSGLDQIMKESRRSDSRSLSLPDLKVTAVAKEVFYENEYRKTDNPMTKCALQHAKQLLDNDHVLKAKGRMSRRDMQFTGQNFRRMGKAVEDCKSEAESWRTENDMINFDNTYQKNGNENVLLKKTGLRLPNTSKLLSAKEHEPNLNSAEIINKLSNKGEKLITNSTDDLSHSDEHFRIIDSAITFLKSSIDTESFHSSTPSSSIVRRHRGHSDITEMLQASNNTENVVFSRNSVSTLLHRCSDKKNNFETEGKFSSQIPYATPPRGYMTFENMKKLGSVKDNDRPRFSYKDLSANSIRNSASGTVKAFGISPMTVTVAKPISFSTSNLSRSNSTPIPSERYDFTTKAASKERPVSMDMDKLTEESDRLVAEMEEYISNSSENIKLTNKFPTSLPAIGVEEEKAGSNRFSMVSSISTSSYESQDSSSSDGLVGTLKSKLRAWARLRNDSEYSFASTFTSDEENQDELIHSELYGALEFQIRNRNAWKDDSESKPILLEQSLVCSEPGSSMSCPLTPISAEQPLFHNCADFSENECHPQGKSNIDYVDMVSDKSEKLSLTATKLQQVELLLTETFKRCAPSALENDELQHFDSDFCFESCDSNLTNPSNMTNTLNMINPLKIISPSNNASPSNNINPTNMTNSTNNINPTNITDSSNNTNPSNTTDPSNMIDSSNNTNPSNNTNSSNNTSPSNMTDLSNITNPSNMSDLSKRMNPSNMSDSSNMTDSSNITNPSNMSDSSNMTDSSNITNPSNMSDSSYKLTLSNMISSSNIANPSNMTKPSNRMNPTNKTAPPNMTDSSNVTDLLNMIKPSKMTNPPHLTNSSNVMESPKMVNPSNMISPSNMTDSSNVMDSLNMMKPSNTTSLSNMTSPSNMTDSSNVTDLLNVMKRSNMTSLSNMTDSSNVTDLSPQTNEIIPEDELRLLKEPSKITLPVAKPLLNTTAPAKESSNFKKNDYFTLLDSSNYYFGIKLSAEFESETIQENSEGYDSSQQECEEVLFPRKSIREFVHDFEEKQRTQSQKVVEVRRREPSVMIRQRLETLRESALHGWRSSSPSSSRPQSEERDFMLSESPPSTDCIINKLPFTITKDDENDTNIKSICAQLLDTKDGLSKSVENLSKCQENAYLPRSRDSLNLLSDVPGNRHSVPIYSVQSNNPGHERDAIRFHCRAPEASQTSSDQFIHRARSSSEHSELVSEIVSFGDTEVAPTQPSESMFQLEGLDTEVAPIQSSESMFQLEGLDTEADDLVVMKGWVRALISKFQDK